MKKVYLKVFMDKNFGDDLMLIKLIKSFPDTYFFVYCEDKLCDFYEALLKEFSNYELTTVELRHVRKFGCGFFDMIILMGGSVLQGTRNKGCFYRARNIASIRFASLFGTKYAIIGCNTGPFINKITRYFVERELRTASLITTRDKASYHFITKANPKAEIYQYSDLLMNFSDDYMFGKIQNKTAKLGISVLNSGNPHLSNVQKIIYFAELADIYIEKTGGKVCLLAFDSGKQDDVVLAKQIYEQIKHKEFVVIVAHDTDYMRIPTVINECTEIIAVRFHAVILGASFGIKTLPIIYSNKTENLLRDLNYEGAFIELESIEKMNPTKLVDLLISSDYKLNVSKVQMNQANEHMEVLKKYLL